MNNIKKYYVFNVKSYNNFLRKSFDNEVSAKNRKDLVKGFIKYHLFFLDKVIFKKNIKMPIQENYLILNSYSRILEYFPIYQNSFSTNRVGNCSSLEHDKALEKLIETLIRK